MKIGRAFRLIFATGCCVALAPIIEAKPGGGNSGHGMGNSGFGHSQKSGPQTGPGNSSYGRMTAQAAKEKTKRKRKAQLVKSTKGDHGNSAFGHRQGDASTRTKGSQNNAFGQQNAALHRHSHSSTALPTNSGDADVSVTPSTEPGNSAFGHRQGDATTRTTGSQNNAYGKLKSAAAHTKHDGGNDDASASPAPSPGE
jgi:hypothetical protein